MVIRLGPERAVPRLLDLSRSTRRRGRCPARRRPSSRATGETCPQCGEGTLDDASAAGSGRSWAARATRTARTSSKEGRRPRTSCRSRSSAPRTATVTWWRVARGAPATSSGGARTTRKLRLHDELRADRGASTTPDDGQGAVARRGEAGMCLNCGATVALPEGDLVGLRLAGGPPDPAALERPARGGGAVARRGGARGGAGAAAADDGAGASRRGRDATDRVTGPTTRVVRTGRERAERDRRRDRRRRSRGSCAPSRRATPRPTPAAPTRRRSGRTSTGSTSRGVDWRSPGRTDAARLPRAPRRRAARGPRPPSVSRRIRSFHRYAARAGSRPATRGGRSRRRACRAACPRVLEVDQVERLLAVVDESSHADAEARPAAAAASTPRSPRHRAARPGARRDRLRRRAADQRAGRRGRSASLDLRRGELRVLGKGRKERIGLLGRPAREALAAYLEDGRPALARPAAPPTRRADRPVFLNHLGSPLGVRGLRCRLDRLRRRRRPPEGVSPAHAAPLASRRTCSRAARTCGWSRSCSATRASRRRRSTRTCRRRASARPTGWRTRGPGRRERRPDDVHRRG